VSAWDNLRETHNVAWGRHCDRFFRFQTLISCIGIICGANYYAKSHPLRPPMRTLQGDADAIIRTLLADRTHLR